MRKSQVTEYIECGHCFECGGIDKEWVELLIFEVDSASKMWWSART